jgi:poly-gamma-glutamate capsule biosynthesis protein CapA/YwtB (metallophosphatase superfamily)
MKHIPMLLLSGYLGLSLLAAQDVPVTRPAAYAPSDNLYSKDTIRLAAVGDIMLGSTYPSLSYLAPNDGRRLLDQVKPWLQKADVSFGNLEGTVFDGPGTVKNCQDPTKCYAFRSPARYAFHLKEAGFDLLSVANNHMGDFGDIGRRATVRNLDSAGIASSGQLFRPYTQITVKGKTIGMLAFAPNSGCVSLNDTAEAMRLVRKHRNQCDILIVSFHGGAEGSAYRHVPKQREVFLGENRGDVYRFAHRVIDEGADVVLGHGPHVTRGSEVYKGRFITYSMGNFCTYGRFSLKGPNGMAPLFSLDLLPDGRFAGGWIVPVKQYGEGGPVLDPNGEVIREIAELSRLDFNGAGLDVRPNGRLLPK